MSYRGMSVYTEIGGEKVSMEIEGEFPSYGDYAGMPNVTLYSTMGTDGKRIFYTGQMSMVGYDRFLKLTPIGNDQKAELRKRGIKVSDD